MAGGSSFDGGSFSAVNNNHHHRGLAEQIRFKVISSSLALQDYPAQELERPSANSKGYLTSQVPGELVLELIGEDGKPACFDVSQLHVLSHESKIASRIEVYVLESPSNTIKSVGYLELDDNSRSGYMARELQCVQLGCTSVTQVRLVLQEPYRNELNPKQHVGVVGLSLLGWKHTIPQQQPDVSTTDKHADKNVTIASSHHSVPSQTSIMSAIESKQVSDSVAQLTKRAEELRLAKESAVRNESYDEAMKLKIAEQEARRLAEIASDLDRAKQTAIEREDYDEAKRIKAKLDEILHPRSSSHAHGQFQAGPMSPKATPSRSRPSMDRPASPPVPAHQARKSMSPAEQYSQTSYSKEDAEGPPIGFWDDARIATDESSSLPVAEPLEASLKTSVEVKSLVSNLGMYAVRCLYSADIRLRSAIIEKLDRQIQGSDDELPFDYIQSLLYACSMGLSESAPHMFLASCHLLETTLSKLSMEDVEQSSICQNTIVPHLVEQFGNQSTHVQEKAMELFSNFASIFGVDYSVRMVVSKTTSSSASAARRSTLWRPIRTRLLVLQKFVAWDEFDPVKWSLDILEWMKHSGAFYHANELVRDASRDLTVLLYSKRGTNKFEIEDFLRSNLRQSTLEKYIVAFTTRDGTQDGGGSSSTTGSPMKMMSSPSKQQQGKVSSSPSRGGATSNQSPSRMQAATCQFCHQSNAAFMDIPDSLDLHFWRDCPMLVHCPHCNQVIEIARLNEHLLAECDFKLNHRACPRCGEAIAAQLFEKHVRRGSCLPALPNSEANRCPLCHNDIAPFQAGWKSHLMVDGCPNNVRTMVSDDDEEGAIE